MLRMNEASARKKECGLTDVEGAEAHEKRGKGRVGRVVVEIVNEAGHGVLDVDDSDQYAKGLARKQRHQLQQPTCVGQGQRPVHQRRPNACHVAVVGADQSWVADEAVEEEDDAREPIQA